MPTSQPSILLVGPSQPPADSDRPAAAVWALSRYRRLALLIGAVLVPWSALMAVSLPSAARADRWSLAWTGLDCAEAAAALLTGWLLGRGDVRAAITAAITGALLAMDAWFDVLTAAPGLARGLATTEALGLELPLAAGALLLAVRILRPLTSPGKFHSDP